MRGGCRKPGADAVGADGNAHRRKVKGKRPARPATFRDRERTSNHAPGPVRTKGNNMQLTDEDFARLATLIAASEARTLSRIEGRLDAIEAHVNEKTAPAIEAAETRLLTAFTNGQVPSSRRQGATARHCERSTCR